MSVIISKILEHWDVNNNLINFEMILIIVEGHKNKLLDNVIK